MRKQAEVLDAIGFQSTPLSRGETLTLDSSVRDTAISIHSPLTRGDAQALVRGRHSINFNPLPSHEGRRRSGGRKTTD